MGAHSAVCEEKSVSTTGTFMAITAAMGIAGIAGVVAAPEASAASLLDNIAKCESGGDPLASNGTHFGLFQFDLATWHSVGGTGDPRNAPIAEQYARAAQLMASRGTQPWDASKRCWSGKPVTSAQAKIALPTAKPKAIEPTVKLMPTVKPIPTVKPTLKPKIVPLPVARASIPTPVHDQVVASIKGIHTVLRGDTLSQIAVDNHVKGGWPALYNLNRHIIGNPNLIYPGQAIRLA